MRTDAGRRRPAAARPAAARHVATLCALTAIASLLAGCTAADPEPSPTPGGTATPRPFTVMSTDPIRVSDPAAITDAASAVISANVFQRLLTAAPGESVSKPDAARECGYFVSTTVYTCTLNEGLTFHNGHELTSSDVKFSIERATRLDVPGSSAPLLDSLRKIETPDALTIRFELSRPDSQFNWALASPAASIVDEEIYDTDEIRPVDETIVGSGPFQVSSFEDGNLDLARFPGYRGFTPAGIEALRYTTAQDSATIEDAMSTGRTDVVWRGLNAAAITRLTSQVAQSPERTTADGFTLQTKAGQRVRQLSWSASSALRSDKRLRQAISTALQGDRTLDSIVPVGIYGHSSVFPLGGRATAKVTWKNRIQLTLGYDSTAPDARDIATQLRTRLEDTGGMSVRLRPDDTGADLVLIDRKAWTATALAWLQPYLEQPLDSKEDEIAELETAFRATAFTERADQLRLLARLQTESATDLTVLPLTQADEHLFVGRGAEVSETSWGPGWQLGLWGIRRV